MLAQTLQWLEDDGLVERKSFPALPPHVEYSLSPLGREVGVKVEALADWIEFHLPHIMRVRAARAQPPGEAALADRAR